jgi:hypothetical protein
VAEDNKALAAAFSDIAQSLSELRLTK